MGGGFIKGIKVAGGGLSNVLGNLLFWYSGSRGRQSCGGSVLGILIVHSQAFHSTNILFLNDFQV